MNWTLFKNSCRFKVVVKKSSVLLGESSFPIIRNILRLVSLDNYATNFGLQWNNYKLTQLDSYTGLTLSHDRLFKNSFWKKEDLKGKVVLEIGAGAGRFTELLLNAGANVISFDLSSAVDANYSNNCKHASFFIFQGDIYNMPFKDNHFDYILVYGVLQHLPDPKLALNLIVKLLKPNGKLSFDYYRKFKMPNVWSTPKYFWRPLTKRLNPNLLLSIIKLYLPFYLPFDNFIRKVPKIGPVILSLIPIPCWNYVFWPLTYKQRLNWAIMDTFDALGACYDKPLYLKDVIKMTTEVISENKGKFSANYHYGGTGIVCNLNYSI